MTLSTRKWKIEFNSNKSVAFTSGNKIYDSYSFVLGGNIVPNCESFVYLGLPIGSNEFINEFINLKFRNVEKALFSLKGLGVLPKTTGPLTIGYLYKTYCQSIFRYPMNNLM
ncbi:unnamed protein product [Brachionus calyciflorus]|uniref:Uncharacterized protein n=1 Tax=Brachionus calyciflorus TaxID=104777 RepID=A0A814KFK7_9BILA|nr:unnamed protein product [Brachionus calyciflorus]